MSLAKAYENYVDNGGQIAIRGYNFQIYVGVFLMLYLHKNNHYFEISFEKDDDISLNDLTNNEKFKIQVKSEKLTPNKITKVTESEPRSILGKLLFNSSNYNYVVLAFAQEKGDRIKELCREESKNLGNSCYSIDWSKCQNIKKNNKLLNNYQSIDDTFVALGCPKEKLLFHEAPFTTASDNCLNYLCGYSPNTYEGTVKGIQATKNQILCILGSIYQSIDKNSQIQKFNNKIFEEMEEQNKKEELIDGILREIESKKGFRQLNFLKNNKADYFENKKIYENLLKGIVLPRILDTDMVSEYVINNAEKVHQNLDPILQKRINIFIIEWYIIDKFITEGFMNYEN